MSKKELTDKQKQILEFVETFFRTHSYWPSVRQIQHHFGFRSTNAVMGHMRAIEKKQHIRRVRGRARAFQLSHPSSEPITAGSSIISIPIFGSIAAGYPDRVESGDAIGQLQLDTQHTPIDHPTRAFALKVEGDSMQNAGILSGDLVVVEKGTPRNNDIVAALIDGEITLKRFIKPTNDAAPFLKAENPRYKDLEPSSDLQVQGIVKSVIRTF